MKTKIEVEMYTICCSKCSVMFAIPNELDSRLRKCHNTFYCPNGHTQYYPQETTEERLRKQLAEKESTLAYYKRQEEARREKEAKAAKKRAATLKAKKEKK